MKTRTCAKIGLALLLVIAVIPCCKQKDTNIRMNVLVITIDTMRADHVGFYGDAKAQTPILDRLARTGVTFRNCYSAVPLTLPSHCSIFTGRLPLSHGVRNNGFYHLGSTEITLARILQERGYQTAALIAAYVLLGKYGLNNGFGWYDDALRSDQLTSDFDSAIPADQVYKKFHKYMTSGMQAPFFLWVHLYDPHKPYNPPQEYARRFPNDLYRGEIAFTDNVIGQMLRDIQEQGLMENTLVVVAGDHGEAFGEHEEFGHGVFCYEEDIKVPLIFSNPKMFSRPRLVEDRVRLIDIMPTVLELLGMPLPAQIQGRTMVPLLKGEKEKTPRDSYMETMYGKEENNWAALTGMISGSFKYISLPKAELYDLANDRLEKQNLFLKKNAQARKMDAQLAAFVSINSKKETSERMELSATDKKQLQTLGYISSFSNAGTKAIDPKDGIQLVNRLEKLNQDLAQGKIDQVQRELEGIIKDPQNQIPAIFQILTTIYRKKRDLHAMLAHLNFALTVFRNTPMENHFRLNLAQLLVETNKLDQAQPLADQVLKEDKQNIMALVLQGEIAVKRMDADKAVEKFSMAEQLEPNNFALKKKLAELYLKNKNIPAALNVYRRLLSIEGSQRDAELLFQIATLAGQTGNLDEAEGLLREAIAKKGNGRYLFHLALIQSKKGDPETALSTLEEAVTRYSKDLTPEQLQTARKLLAQK